MCGHISNPGIDRELQVQVQVVTNITHLSSILSHSIQQSLASIKLSQCYAGVVGHAYNNL